MENPLLDFSNDDAVPHLYIQFLSHFAQLNYDTKELIQRAESAINPYIEYSKTSKIDRSRAWLRYGQLCAFKKRGLDDRIGALNRALHWAVEIKALYDEGVCHMELAKCTENR